jgi:uncharacterized protein (DUF1501 family)
MTRRPPTDAARRAFLRRGALLGLAGSATPWALNLSLLGDAAAAGNPDDYKALVCVFLYGGNDHGNTLVPVDSAGHAAYSSIRGELALARADLAATTLTPVQALPGGQQYALAPSLSPLKGLWDSQRLAVQLNVGPLMQPTTVAQYQARSVPLPPKLFSHNDQQSTWQSDLPEGAVTGWGGRIGDLMLAGNGGSVFSCISVTGNAVFLSGQQAVQYQLGSNGAVAINGLKSALYGSTAAQAALRSLVTAPRSHLFADEWTRITRRSVDAEMQVTGALAALPTLATPFDSDNALALQLRMVARMIAARSALGPRRQVFLVSLGGFDTHSDLLDTHPVLLAKVAGALKSFHDATVELGVERQVTAFTASDFGRTLSVNGDGSDHGWGSHHLVLGGAVKGGRYYGQPPAVAVNGPDDVGQGRLLPTTSVDSYAATLATWFGVADSELATVVPRIGNFDTRNLGFV